MPDIGNTTEFANYNYLWEGNGNDSVRGIQITMTEDGTADSISAYITTGANSARTAVFALYDSSGNLLGYSNESAGSHTDEALLTLNLDNEVSAGDLDLTNGSSYYLFAAFSGGTGAGGIANAGAPNNVGYSGDNSSTYPALASTAGTIGQTQPDYSIYLTYSTGGSVITTTTGSITYTTQNATVVNGSVITTSPVSLTYTPVAATVDFSFVVTTTTESITYAASAASVTAIAKSVDSITGTVAPGEQITVNCTGFGTVNTVTLGGESLTIDAQNNGNPICTIPTNINIKWAQSYNLAVTDPYVTEQLSTTLNARTGWEVVEWVGPAPDTGTTESFYEEAIADFSITADTGDQLQHTTAANMTVDGQWIPTVSPAGSRSGTYAVWDESASARSSEAAWSIVINASITTTTPSITYTPVAATVTAATILQTNTRQIVYSPFSATVGNENVISTTTPSITYATSSATVSSIAGLVTNRASIRYTAIPATVSSPSVWTEIPRSSTTWTEV